MGTAPPTSPIDADIACMHCGYNLRGLDDSGQCPECGHDILLSVQRAAGGAVDGKWHRTIASGIRWIILSHAAAVVGTIAAMLVIALLGRAPSHRFIDWSFPAGATITFAELFIGSRPLGALLVVPFGCQTFLLPAATMAAVGAWRLATPERAADRPAIALRVVAVIYPIAVLVNAFVWQADPFPYLIFRTLGGALSLIVLDAAWVFTLHQRIAKLGGVVKLTPPSDNPAAATMLARFWLWCYPVTVLGVMLAPVGLLLVLLFAMGAFLMTIRGAMLLLGFADDWRRVPALAEQ